MAWCPKCKNEYVEGIKVCADCGTELVDSLEESRREGLPLFLKEYADEIAEVDEAEKIMAEDGLTDGEEEIVEELSAGEIAVDIEDEKSEGRSVWQRPYQNNAQKAEDNKSSAYTLLFIGVIGLTACILILMGVIPLYQNSVISRYFVCGVMGVLFVIFIIFGIISMKNFRALSIKAESEDSLVSEMTKWCGENLSAGRIDEGLFEAEDMAEEQKYFKRVDKMKRLIQDKFLNLEEDFLDSFVDDYYQNLF